MSDKNSKKITVSFNVNPPNWSITDTERFLQVMQKAIPPISDWSIADTERFLQAMQKAMPPISAGGFVVDRGRLMPSYYSHEYVVPEKVMQFNFSTGEWE